MVTDHKPLVWFQNSKDPCSRVTRWKLKLSEYDFDVAYKAGKTHVNADASSRNPIDLDDIEKDDIVSQFLKCVMDSILTLLENKKECYAMQTRGQLKYLRNINMVKNEDTNEKKLLRNVEVTNKVQMKRGRPRKIIQEIKLQESIKKRGRTKKVINKSPENDKNVNL